MKRKLLTKYSLFKIISLLIFAIFAFSLTQFQQKHFISTAIASDKSPPVTLIPGIGSLHHTVATHNANAQRFFDQGLTQFYAYHYYEAIRSFRRAAELDPQLAMAYWGIALASGSNVRTGAKTKVDLAAERTAYEAMQKALELASRATEREEAYITALAKRYTIDPKEADLKKLSLEYKNAMQEVVKRYPDDIDAAVLYAQSSMDINSWQLWSPSGKPAEHTEEIVAVLESALKRNPQHVGAHHLYIHAVEAAHPERALHSAHALGRLAPSVAHLVHMPAHIFMGVGDYESAARSSEIALEIDKAYLEDNNIQDQDIYPLLYYSHHLHLLWMVYSMQGRFADMKSLANHLAAHYSPYFKKYPSFEIFMPTPTLTLVRFRRWDDILSSSKPNQEMAFTNALWHFGRGMAYAAKGNVKDAESEQKIFTKVGGSIPVQAETFGHNSKRDILKIAQLVLDSKISLARNDNESAIELLKKAVKAEDSLYYFAPSVWFFSVRESLGGLLLLNRNYEAAEQVFRADLERHPCNGHSLFGLMNTLEAQGKKPDAQLVKREFKDAWKFADTQLRVQDL